MFNAIIMWLTMILLGMSLFVEVKNILFTQHLPYVYSSPTCRSYFHWNRLLQIQENSKSPFWLVYECIRSCTDNEVQQWNELILHLQMISAHRWFCFFSFITTTTTTISFHLFFSFILFFLMLLHVIFSLIWNKFLLKSCSSSSSLHYHDCN